MSETIESFLEHIAAPTPTPGGGTVSAVAGAMGVALSRMAASLAVGKPGYEAVQSDLAAIEAQGKALQQRFLDLAAEDARAYEGVVEAMRRPKGTDAEKAARKAGMQEAFKRATDVPLETMRAALEALELSRLAADKGNKNAVSDAGVAALLAEAALRGAALNVRINLAAISDRAWRDGKVAELDALLQKGAGLAHAIDVLVASKM